MLHLNHVPSIVFVLVMLSLSLAVPVPAAAHTPGQVELPQVKLNNVWGNSGSDVFAVGADTTILHYDGKAWSHMSTDTSAAQTTSTAPISTTAEAKPVKSVLFVGDGNSVLVDDYLGRLAKSDKTSPRPRIDRIHWDGIATDEDSSLEVQWKSFSANGTQPIKEVPDGEYDSVVLEQNLGEGWPDSAASFAEYAAKWHDAIKQAGARTFLYTPWAPKSGAPTPQDSATVYDKVAAELGAKVAPVGLAFQRALKERPDLPLYEKDGDDRNANGFYLSLCVLYATLLDRSPVGLPYRMEDLTGVARRATLSALNTPEDWTLSEADAAFLQRVAWDTVTEYRAKQAEGAAPAASAAKPIESVLFVGDSLSTNLDLYFPKLAASGQAPITIESLLTMRGGARLSQHWGNIPPRTPNAPEEIKSGKWDVVVLQDGLGKYSDSEIEDFLDAARKFHGEITRAGAQTVLYMSQPEKRDPPGTTERMAAAYREAAEELGVKVAPVGLAYARSLKERPDLNLIADDGVHGNAYGFYLTMCVLYSTIFDRSPVGQSYRLEDVIGYMPLQGWWNMPAGWVMAEADAAFLQKVAWDTVREYRGKQAKGAVPAVSAAKSIKSVLFVGHSKILNVNNDFPRLAASGQPPITIESDLAYLPGSRLVDHWVSDATRKPSAREEIPSGRWDVVVLEEEVQEQPPSQRAEFVEYARKFDAAIRQSGSATVLYMAYGPRGAGAPIVDDIATAYTGLGAELGAPVAPAALTYQRSLKERPELNLYDDIDHGNSYGNYLAACVLYATIFDRSPVGLSDRMGGMVSDADAAYLQKVAWDTVQEYKAQH
jgi:hypothetical protein